jgi:nicotinamidase-related amidase
MDLLRTLSDKVSPARAAVVTVDVQNDFCDPQGFLGKLGAPMAQIQAMLPRLAAFLEAARAHGVLS